MIIDYLILLVVISLLSPKKTYPFEKWLGFWDMFLNCPVTCEIYQLLYILWLVVWNIFYFPIQLGIIIIPIDFHIFRRDGSTTNQIFNMCEYSTITRESTWRYGIPSRTPRTPQDAPSAGVSRKRAENAREKHEEKMFHLHSVSEACWFSDPCLNGSLVGGLEHLSLSHMLGIIIPID